MTGFSRPALARRLAERAARGPAWLLAGPPGAGKTTALLDVAARLRELGLQPVYLDLLLAVASPERFTASAAAALRAAGVEAVGDADGPTAVLEAWRTTRDAGGRELVLLLDEPTEIRALATFPGLRDVESRFGRALAARRGGAVLATSYPTAAARLGPFETVPLPPLSAEELEPLVGSRAAPLARAGGGLPAYVDVLLPRVLEGEELATAWVDSMAPGGGLDRACRRSYETLLLRSRGYAMSKAVLEAVALEEGLNLTALVARLGRTPGAVRDYLGWLLDVDALRSERKRYYFVDPLLRHWLRLNAGGRPPDSGALRAAAEEILGPGAAPEPPRERHDSLMEID